MLSVLSTARVSSIFATASSSKLTDAFHGILRHKSAVPRRHLLRGQQSHFRWTKPTKHTKLCQPAKATIALQGAPGLLIGLGAFLAGVALAAFLLAAIPTLLSVRRAARAVEIMLYTVEREVPETAAAMRLSSMELSDAIEEVTLLSNDLSSGVRSSAAAMTAAEQGMRQGAQYVNLAVKESIIPSVRSKVPAARGAVESQLQETAKLQHTDPAIGQLARSTKTVTGQLRFGLSVVTAISRAAITRRVLQQKAAS